MNPILRVRKELEHKLRLDPKNNQWVTRHLNAWLAPEAFEYPIRQLIGGLDAYGKMVRKNGRLVGEDLVLGPAVKSIAESILVLLNGDIGRFDGGTLDKLVRAICVEYGVGLDT